METLLHIRTHLKEDVRECGSHATLDKVLEALRSKYELTILEARTRLTSLKRNTKLSLTDHAREVKRLVEAAYADLPRTHRQEMILDLFRNSLNHAYLQRHLLAMKPQSFSEAIADGNEYFQIRPNLNLGVTIRQVEEEEGNLESVQVAQSTPSEIEILIQALRQITSEVASLEQTQKLTATKPKKKGPCCKCGGKGHLEREIVPLSVRETNKARHGQEQKGL